MALDPDGTFSQGWWDNPDDFPAELPNGVTKSPQFYAHYEIKNDGRRIIQWYKRGSGGASDGQGDAVLATTQDKVPKVEQDFRAQAQRGDQEGDVRGNEATNPNREVFHTGRGWVVEPNPLYRPPANAAGGTIQIEGTPNGQGFDNERPVMVTRDASGKITESRPLTPAEEKDWRENRERSRNPGGKTDAEVQAQQPGRVSVPVEGYPGISQVTTKDPQTNAQESHFENAQGQTVPDPRPAASETKPKYGQIRQDEQTGKWFGLTPSGQWEEIQGGPNAAPGKKTSRSSRTRTPASGTG
jgi:hypothetical protein